METGLMPYTPGAIVGYKPKIQLPRTEYWKTGGLASHPVLIISTNFAENGSRYQVMPISSQISRYYGYRIWTGTRWSVICCNEVHTIDYYCFGQFLGYIPQELLKKCLKAYAWVIGLSDEIPEYYREDPAALSFFQAGPPNIPTQPIGYLEDSPIAWHSRGGALGPQDIPEVKMAPRRIDILNMIKEPIEEEEEPDEVPAEREAPVERDEPPVSENPNVLVVKDLPKEEEPTEPVVKETEPAVEEPEEEPKVEEPKEEVPEEKPKKRRGKKANREKREMQKQRRAQESQLVSTVSGREEEYDSAKASARRKAELRASLDDSRSRATIMRRLRSQVNQASNLEDAARRLNEYCEYFFDTKVPITMDRMKEACVFFQVDKRDWLTHDQLDNDTKMRYNRWLNHRVQMNAESTEFRNSFSHGGDVIMLKRVRSRPEETTRTMCHYDVYCYVLTRCLDYIWFFLDPDDENLRYDYIQKNIRKLGRQPHDMAIMHTRNAGRLTATDLRTLEKMAGNTRRINAVCNMMMSVLYDGSSLCFVGAMEDYSNELEFREAITKALLTEYEYFLIYECLIYSKTTYLQIIQKFIKDNMWVGDRVPSDVKDVPFMNVIRALCRKYNWEISTFGDEIQAFQILNAAMGDVDIFNLYKTMRLSFIPETEMYFRYQYDFNLPANYREMIELDDSVKGNCAYIQEHFPMFNKMILDVTSTRGAGTSLGVMLIYAAFNEIQSMVETIQANLDKNPSLLDDSGPAMDIRARLQGYVLMLHIVKMRSIIEFNIAQMKSVEENPSDILMAMASLRDVLTLGGMTPKDCIELGVSLKDFKAACEITKLPYEACTYVGIIDCNDLYTEDEKEFYGIVNQE